LRVSRRGRCGPGCRPCRASARRCCRLCSGRPSGACGHKPCR
jgi:hypothetical protein